MSTIQQNHEDPDSCNAICQIAHAKQFAKLHL